MILIASCNSNTSSSVEITSLRVFAPLPGTNTAVAYMTIVNKTDNLITFRKVHSPEFEHAEIHENTLENGISRMRRLDKVTISEGDTVIFNAGGMHIMLVEPREDMVVGSHVTLQILHDYGELKVTTKILNRLSGK
tara:strand:+ start:87 stop:494 length:408 start_codon:yes stop_codon:yes gene_type:complete